jgi:hypothetical protein
MNITRLMKNFQQLCFPTPKILLGRWNIDNYKKTILKINYANEDNSLCNHELVQKDNLFDDTLYIYMMGYESVHK